MHRLTLATIVLSIGLILSSQLPFIDLDPPINEYCECPALLHPCSPGEACGFTATRTVFYWDGFPIAALIEIGLVIVWLKLRRELVLARLDEA